MPVEIPAQFNLAAHFLDRPAGANPSKSAILGEPHAVSYRELAGLANRVGNRLRDAGCEPGDRVLIILPDSVEFMAAFFGTAKIGCVAVPVNPMARQADYAYYLEDASPRAAIVHEVAFPELLPALRRSSVQVIVAVGSAEAVGGSAAAWVGWLREASARLEPARTRATDTAFFLYTSGSGGQPKAAVHQHKDMLVTTESFAKGVLDIQADDRTFSVSKLFFAYGLGNGMYFPFSVGASTILNPERPKPEKVLHLVAKHRPTLFFSVPTFFASLLRAVAEGARADFSSVRLVVSAGEWLPPEICEQFRKRFDLEILDGIGSTEMLHMFVSSRPGQARPGSCGFVVPNYEARIVDESETSLLSGRVGSLWVRGQSAFAGYWNKPELTARAKRGEWIVTGDQFFVDHEGYYHYFGRTDDMMKVGGMWVSPGEVENALLGHPAVAEAAVVARATAEGLTRPVGYVVLREAGGSRELEEELYRFVRGRLVSYKCPQEIEFVAELPKTATGKIQRYRLRQGSGE